MQLLWGHTHLLIEEKYFVLLHLNPIFSKMQNQITYVQTIMALQTSMLAMNKHYLCMAICL